MKKAEQVALVEAAVRASRRAMAPYSKFSVGAAILSRAGKVYTGANVESASFGLSCCAERIALFKALSEGDRSLAAIAVVAPMDNGPMPCGACRQLLAEFAPDAVLFVADTRNPRSLRRFTVAQLLPDAFLDVPPLDKTPKRQ